MPSVEITKPSAHEADVFWGEISPCEHLVQIYQDEGVFLNALEGFVAGGFKQAMVWSLSQRRRTCRPSMNVCTALTTSAFCR